MNHPSHVVSGITGLVANRCFNFSAGPAMLPQDVMLRMQEEFLHYQQCGASVMEISHRGETFMALAEKAEHDLRALMDVPDDYAVIFSHGGATHQAAFLALNLTAPTDKAGYVINGHWSDKAHKQAVPYCDAQVLDNTVDIDYQDIRLDVFERLDPSLAYVHITSNETIHGVQYQQAPQTGDVPLIADMCSDILSRPLDVRDYGMIYAGAQKNIGSAGLSIAIIRRDLLERQPRPIADVLNYAKQAERDSMVNTPPTHGWYVAGKVFEWLREQGGVKAMHEINQRKAKQLYETIDCSGGFYRNHIATHVRSIMNVPFQLPNQTLTDLFLAQAAEHGMVGLKGHRAVGGVRASIYNAMPESGVVCLRDFMKTFQQTHG